MKERIVLDNKKDVYEIYQDFMSGHGKAYEKITRKQIGDEIGEKLKKDPAYLLEMLSEDELRFLQRLDHHEHMILIEGNMDIFSLLMLYLIKVDLDLTIHLDRELEPVIKRALSMADWDQIHARQQREFAVLGILRSCVVMPVDLMESIIAQMELGDIQSPWLYRHISHVQDEEGNDHYIYRHYQEKMIFFLAAASYYDAELMPFDRESLIEIGHHGADLRIDVVRQAYDLLRQNEIDEYWLQYLYCVHLRNGDIASWVDRGVKGISKEEKAMLVQAARKIRNGVLRGSTLEDYEEQQDPEKLQDVRDALIAHPEWLDDFIQENPSHFDRKDLCEIQQFHQAVPGVEI